MLSSLSFPFFLGSQEICFVFVHLFTASLLRARKKSGKESGSNNARIPPAASTFCGTEPREPLNTPPLHTCELTYFAALGDFPLSFAGQGKM